MGNYFPVSKGVGRSLLLGCAATTLLLLSSQSIVYAAGETSTSMTVITVDDWQNGSPSVHTTYTVDTILLSAHYQPGHMSWSTSPSPRHWGETLPNDVTGNLWVMESFNGGTTFAALSWDFIGNDTAEKHINNDPTNRILFTMLSSLCDQGSSGKCATPNRVRTNTSRWPELIEATGNLRIEPPNVGAFTTQETQQFELYDGSTKIDSGNVDWWISEAPAYTSGLEPDAIATIDKNGLATILSTKGTVKVSACYPSGCGPGGIVNTGMQHLLLGTK